MIKEKICKGQGVAVGYGCGKMINVSNRVYGLGKMCCYANWLMTSENGKIKMQKAILKVKPPVVKFNEEKARIETTDWNKKAQTKINLIVRLIDKGLPCLAKNIHAKQMHAGHVYSRGSNPMMRFNLHNIHRQSAQSNHFQNEDGIFREGILKEYGKEYYDFISDLRQIKDLKLSVIELHSLYKKVSKIALILQKKDITYDLQQRIALRNEINTELEIYEKDFCVYFGGLK
jgi:hypothetical protein